MDERAWRLLAAEQRVLGRGGIKVVAAAVMLIRKRWRRGCGNWTVDLDDVLAGAGQHGDEAGSETSGAFQRPEAAGAPAVLAKAGACRPVYRSAAGKRCRPLSAV